MNERYHQTLHENEQQRNELVELRSSLQAAVGAELPATLVFEAPTERLIAGVLTPDAVPLLKAVT